MEVLKNIINQFMDPQLLIIIGCLILALILLRVLNNFLSRHKVLKVVVIGAILVSVAASVFWIIDHREEFYSSAATHYVYGQVKDVNSGVNKIDVQVTRSNLTFGKSNLLNGKKVTLNVNKNCKFIDKNGKNISFSDIGYSDTVQIYVLESNIDDVSSESLTAVKVILKN